jgi:uncharacterized membrane protein
MGLMLLIGLMGLGIGALLLGKGGWLVGAVIGALIARILQFNKLVQNQTKELSLLQTMQEYLLARLRELEAKKEMPVTQNNPSVAETSQEEPQKTEEKNTEPLVIDLNLDNLLAKAEQQIVQPIVTAVSTIKEEIKGTKEEIQETKEEVKSEPEKNPLIDNPSHFPASQQTIEDKLTGLIRNFFLGGNPVVRVGMLILFIGLSFLVKLAASGGYFPIELRLSCVAAIAIALIAVGWRTRFKEGSYGLVLQGGGLAALYLTSFAAAKMYHLMPSSVALVLLFIFVVFGAILALLQNAQILAIVATAGGFLAPILTSDGSGNHVGLFSVYLVLNIGILAMSWFKTWRLLNWIGFVFTFIISTAWGVLKYEPQFYLSTQPFLAAFFFLYLTVSILFSLKQPPNLKGLVDGSLVFGLPVVGFSLQVALLKHTEYGLAISALILAFVYLGLARWLWMKYLQTHKLLIESFMALGVGFATLAIPLGLNADWTSATWAFEALGLIWIGLRQQRVLPRLAGIALYFLACIATLADNGLSTGVTPIITGDFISVIILSLAGFAIAWCFFHYASASAAEAGFGKCLILVSVFWWLVAVLMECNAHMLRYAFCVNFYFILAASILLQMWIAKKLNWSSLGKATHVYLAVSILLTLWGFMDEVIPYPTSRVMGLQFWVFFAVLYYFFKQLEKIEWNTGLQVAHLTGGLLALLVLLWQTTGVIGNTQFLMSVMHPDTAKLFIWFIFFVPSVVFFILLNSRGYWPASQWKTLYQGVIPAPFFIITFALFFAAIKESGNIFEFYLPVLNPVDLMQLAVIVLTGFVFLHGLAFSHTWLNLQKIGLIGIMSFIWINTVTFRAIHQYTGIEYDFSTLWQSSTVQMALSILWSASALVIMNLSRRMQSRTLWIVGGSLLLMVILKLFTKDLSNSGTVARIVSFMAVGGFMLLIGYLSPMPPAKKDNQESSK